MMQADPILLTAIGTAAGVLILVGWVNQIYQGLITKRLGDVSRFLMIFIGAGSVLWVTYGVMTWDVFIIGTNVAAVILMCTVLAMKARYDGRR